MSVSAPFADRSQLTAPGEGLGHDAELRLVAPPETHGVIERLFRTVKEQVAYGHIFQTIEAVRDAVRAFVARYNYEWLAEKNGLANPTAAREGRMADTLKPAA